MTDLEILTLCAFQEANLEPDDGVAAIIRVIQNRMRRRFFSDGTVAGTVFAHNQFSWAEWSMVDGKYTRVATGPDEVQARAEQLLTAAKGYEHAWERISSIVAQVLAGTYSGPDYAKLTDDTVLYDNLRLAKPAWAIAEKHVCAIAHHDFFRA